MHPVSARARQHGACALFPFFVVAFTVRTITQGTNGVFERLPRRVLRQHRDEWHRLGPLSRPVMLLSGRVAQREVGDDATSPLRVSDALERERMTADKPLMGRFEMGGWVLRHTT